MLKFPCRYHPMGCKEAHTLSAKAEHERNCPYLQLKCPFHGQCSFGGALSAVVPHLKSEHAVTLSQVITYYQSVTIFIY